MISESPPWPKPLTSLTQGPTPPHCPFTPCPIFLPKPLPHPLSLGHLVTLGPPTPPNFNILTIRVRDSLGYQFKSSSGHPYYLQKKCRIHVKYLTIFNRQFSLGHFVTLGPLTSLNLNISTIWIRDI